jgi:sec-independent protein translocase protein TatB
MFDVGFWELVLIFGVGLMILGPERMPRVAAQIGRWIGRARRTASQLRRQLEHELQMDELVRQRRKAKPGPTAPSPGSQGDADGNSETPDAAAKTTVGSAAGDAEREEVESAAGPWPSQSVAEPPSEAGPEPESDPETSAGPEPRAREP